MTNSNGIAKTTVVDGWSLAFTSADGEPLFRDLDLAERTNLRDPHDIRRAIARAIRDGEIVVPGGDRIDGSCLAYEVIETVPTPKGGKREVIAYYLDEEAALEVLMRLRTAGARALRKQVRQVYLAWRRGELATLEARRPQLDDSTISSARIGDDETAMGKVRLGVERVRRSRDYSSQRVHGLIRKSFKVSSAWAISMHLLPRLIEMLESLETRTMSLLSTREERWIREAERDAKRGQQVFRFPRLA